MISKSNINPDNSPLKGPTPTPSPSAPKAPEGSWNPPPLTWMGMKFDEQQTKQLWNTITQSIGRAIQHEKDRMVAASKKLRKSMELDDDADS
jgi:hypothetical protein